MLKGQADKKAKEEFMRECNMMLEIGEHPNVVQMVGVAVQQVPWLCVLEFQPFGDLREVVMGEPACSSREDSGVVPYMVRWLRVCGRGVACGCVGRAVPAR